MYVYISSAILSSSTSSSKRWSWHVFCFDVHWYQSYYFIHFEYLVLLAQDFQSKPRFSSKEFCPETCGHGQAICLWYCCSCRCSTPSTKYPLLLCFTATDCISKGKKSKTIRAWRLLDICFLPSDLFKIFFLFSLLLTIKLTCYTY